jgi:hypothetical protein
MVNAQVKVMTYAMSSPLRRRCQNAAARPEGLGAKFVVEGAAMNRDY